MTRYLYHPDAYCMDRTVESYWEASVPTAPVLAPLEGEATAEVAIIGGGYTGLSTALHLVRDHGLDVAVLEAGPAGWGASGRNGGFACVGASKLTVAQMIAEVGEDEVRRFYASQVEAVELVRALGEEEGIDFDAQGDGHIEVAHKPNRVEAMREEVELNNTKLGLNSRFLTRDELVARGIGFGEAHAGIHVLHGFGLHPLKYHRGLLKAATAHGARYYPSSKVEGWSREGGMHRLRTSHGSVLARKVVVATNGYTPEDLHPGLAGTFLPAFSNIVTTRPLTPEERQAQGFTDQTPISDSRKLLFYFRLLKDGRLLYGARGDTIGSKAAAARLRRHLIGHMKRRFPLWRDVEITHSWNGLVCLSANLSPIIGTLDDGTVHYGLAYHGNGVGTATWAGRAIARQIVGRNDAGTGLPALVARPPKRFPMPAVRAWYLRAAYVAYRIKDAL